MLVVWPRGLVLAIRPAGFIILLFPDIVVRDP